MSGTKMIFNDERARAEIGYTSRPAREAIEESARWFVDHGYVSAARRAAIRWRRDPLCRNTVTQYLLQYCTHDRPESPTSGR